MNDDIRREAISAAAETVHQVLAAHELHLDLFARFELLEIALDDAEDAFDPPAVN